MLLDTVVMNWYHSYFNNWMKIQISFFFSQLDGRFTTGNQNVSGWGRVEGSIWNSEKSLVKGTYPHNRMQSGRDWARDARGFREPGGLMPGYRLEALSAQKSPSYLVQWLFQDKIFSLSSACQAEVSKPGCTPEFLLFQWLRHVWLFCNPMDCRGPGSSVHGIS